MTDKIPPRERADLSSVPPDSKVRILPLQGEDMAALIGRVMKAIARFKKEGVRAEATIADNSVVVHVHENPLYKKVLERVLNARKHRGAGSGVEAETTAVNETQLRQQFWRDAFLKAFDKGLSFDIDKAADLAGRALVMHDKVIPFIVPSEQKEINEGAQT